MLLALIVGAEAVLLITSRLNPEKQIQAWAARMVKTCGEGDSPSVCYEREIPKLLDRMNMEQVFAVTRAVQEDDPRFSYCHVLGHEVASYETRKDPAKWKDVITRCPSGVCSNGCLHGALQERFRAESLTDAQIAELIPELATVCTPRGAWNPSPIEQASCSHALGHLLMYATNADITRAVAWCEKLDVESPINMLRVCLDGAFMQLYQPLEPEDFVLIAGKEITRGGHEAFCAPFQGSAAWRSCWTEGWPLYLTELQTPSGMDAYCSKVPRDQLSACIESMTYIMVVQFRFNLDALHSYCLGLATDPQTCVSSVATRLLENDNRAVKTAISWCANFSDTALSDGCFGKLASFATEVFSKGTPQHSQLCTSLPAVWQQACAAGQ